MNKITNYQVNGSYIFNGRKGIQIGEVDFYDDGKLLGKIDDKDFNYSGTSRKVLVGLYVPDKSLVSFIKFPLDERLMPVMWSLDSETMHLENKPLGWYSGFWEYLPFRANELPFVEFQGISEDLTRFEEISAGTLRSLFFNEFNLRGLEVLANVKSQKGRVEFTEV